MCWVLFIWLLCVVLIFVFLFEIFIRELFINLILFLGLIGEFKLMYFFVLSELKLEELYVFILELFLYIFNSDW